MPPEKTHVVAAVSCTVVAALAFLFRRQRQQSGPPELVHSDDAQAEVQALLLRCAALLRPYYPSVFHWNGMVTTVLSAPKAAPVPTLFQQPRSKEVPMELEDGGTVSLDWWPPPDMSPQDGGNEARPPVALVLPGLGNSSRTAYVRTTMSRLCSHGFQAVALNYRGVDHLEITSKRVGAADAWEDFSQVLRAIRHSTRCDRIFALGFSMGGVMLMRYLAEHGSASGIEAAVVVSSFIDYEAHGRVLKEQPAASFAMALGVKAQMLPKMRSVLKHIPEVGVRDILLSKTLHDLLQVLVCKANGYASAEDYFQKNSPAPLFHQIACPLLIISARDDPLGGPVCTPRKVVRANPHVLLVETQSGGHIGWAGRGWFSSSWADAVSQRYLSHSAARTVEQHAPTASTAQPRSMSRL